MTAEWLAREMYEQHWRFLGILSVITTDKGATYVGTWWKTLCPRMGAQVAYSHVYHHQANGRAEVAGQVLIRKLRMINQDTGDNWVELLPYVIDRIHDTPGETGYSPYQLVFGRERPMQGLPLPLPKEAYEARDFCEYLRTMRSKAAAILNKKHKDKAIAQRGVETTFAPGDVVWYLRPPNTGDKLDSRWLGPAKVIERTGTRSYKVEVKHGKIVDSPLVF